METSARSVSNLVGLIQAGVLHGQGRIVVQSQPQSLPEAGVIVTLGNVTPAPLTYNAAGLLSVPALGSTTPAANSMAENFNALLVAQANLATAGINPVAATSGDIYATGELQSALANSTAQDLTPLAVANLNLATAAVGSGTETATNVGILGLLGQIQNAPGQNEPLAGNLPPTAVPTPAATVLPATAAAVANPAIAAPVTTNASQAASTPATTVASPVAAAPSSGTASTTTASSTTASSTTPAGFFEAGSAFQALLADASIRAMATVATDPTYAAAAAALYASAGIFQYRQNEAMHLLPRVTSPFPPILPLGGIAPVAAV